MKFIEKPAGARSFAKRKKLYGIGVNDADYVVSYKIDGKLIICPFVRVWNNMLKRCYCRTYLAIQPTYKDCSVCNEWLLFSAFRVWMETQDWHGKELDKDIMQLGNKIYSPSNCIFVTRAINNLLNRRRPRASGLPQGVYWCKFERKYRVEIVENGKKRRVGGYATSERADREYRKAKSAYITSVAMQQRPRLQAALLRHSEALSC